VIRAALLALTVLLLPRVAFAGETATVPKGAFVLDEGFLQSDLDARWDGDRKSAPLIDSIVRYEPGGGLQGTITANPAVRFRLLITKLYYGLTDNWMLAVAVPMVLSTHIDANLGWTAGDYQATLGRRYSERDFWQWAGSLGQPKPASTWTGNKGQLADMIVGTRYRLPRVGVLKRLGLDVAGTLLVALPTGREADPEALLAAGTNTWELHSYGDVEAHVAVDRPFFKTGNISRLSLGLDAYYAYFRPRTYTAPKGTLNPLLLDAQPYVGDHYTIDPGDWWVATALVELTPFIGPARSSFISHHSLAVAEGYPALVQVQLGYSHIHCNPTTWKSDSALWDYQHDALWLDGDKNMLRAQLTVSLLRLGLPLQLYGEYHNQSIIPGKYTRAANTLSAGARIIAKFW